jgi:O-antigen/teichoic acid export membrane protein
VKSQPNLKSEFGQYTGYLFLTSVANLLVQRIDIVMISAMSTFDNTGVYRIALMMSVLIEIPTRSILQISNPKLAEAIHQKNNLEVERLYKKTSLNQFILGCLALLCIWINIDLFFELMPNGSKYIDAKFAVLFLGIGKLFTLLQGNSSAMLTFSKRYYLSLIVNFTAVFLGIYLNQIAIPKWGIEGAAIATATTWLVSGVVIAILIWSIYKMNPMTWKIVFATLVFGLFFILNYYLQNIWNMNHIVFGGLKTAMIMSFAIWSIYRFNLSEDVKSMIQKLLRFSQK